MGNFAISCLIFALCICVSLSQLVQETNGTLLNTIELMGRFGYKGERHEVKTADGYKLTIFRIPPAKVPSPVVLIQHGLSLSSDVFVLQNNSIALVLASKGYDVWLGNSRGNFYSRSHEKLSPNDTKFWDFSYHEIGYYDLPAVIDYILGKTKQPSLFYIGHSMATTQLFVLGSTRPEYNKKIKTAICLAPVAFYTGKITLFVRQPTYVEMSKKYMEEWLKSERVEAFPRPEVTYGTHQGNCSDIPENFVTLCSTILEMVADIIGGPYIPAGFATKILIHYRQNILTDTFKHFDYESESKNKAVYKQATPPDYNLALVTVPTYLVYGPDDMIVEESDINLLKGKLPNVVEAYKVPDPKFGHADYVFVIQDEDEDDRTHFRLDLYEQIAKWLDKMGKM